MLTCYDWRSSRFSLIPSQNSCRTPEVLPFTVIILVILVSLSFRKWRVNLLLNRELIDELHSGNSVVGVQGSVGSGGEVGSEI